MSNDKQSAAGQMIEAPALGGMPERVRYLAKDFSFDQAVLGLNMLTGCQRDKSHMIHSKLPNPWRARTKPLVYAVRCEKAYYGLPLIQRKVAVLRIKYDSTIQKNRLMQKILIRPIKLLRLSIFKIDCTTIRNCLPVL